MNLLSYLWRESRLRFTAAAICGLASGCAAAILARLISEALQGRAGGTQALVLFFGCCLAYLAAKSASEISLMHLVQAAILRVRVDLSRQILATPQQRLQALGKSELLAILTNDIASFVQAFQMLPMAFGNLVILLVCSAYLAWLSASLFTFFGSFLIVAGVGYHLAERRPLRLMGRLREQLEVLYENFRGLVDGTRELQLNARRADAYVDAVIAPAAREFRRFFLGTMAGYTWVSNIGLVLFYVAIGLLLFAAPVWLPQSSGVVATFAAILLFLVRPISDLMFSLPVLRQAGVSLERIRQLEDGLAAPDAGPPVPAVFSRPGPLLIELRGVQHHYRGADEHEQFHLGPLDLCLKGGEIVFIVGGNGSGKTTLAMVLLGLYPPNAGELLLNGVAVDAGNAAAYRQHFSAVFSDFHLFEQLVGSADADAASQARHYLARLEMDHKVRLEDGRFSTVKLSAGQRKRLALVSSYLEDRPIYLFDEWAADQDPAFKRVLYTELLPDLKARGKTVIVITHDDAYFDCADRLVKLEDGRLRVPEVAARPAAADLATQVS